MSNPIMCSNPLDRADPARAHHAARRPTTPYARSCAASRAGNNAAEHAITALPASYSAVMCVQDRQGAAHLRRETITTVVEACWYSRIVKVNDAKPDRKFPTQPAPLQHAAPPPDRQTKRAARSATASAPLARTAFTSAESSSSSAHAALRPRRHAGRPRRSASSPPGTPEPAETNPAARAFAGQSQSRSIAVVTNATCAPCRSSMASVPTVVPCRNVTDPRPRRSCFKPK